MFIKVTWKAFGNKPEIERFESSVTFAPKPEMAMNRKLGTVPLTEVSDLDICEQIYYDTNSYSGSFYELIEPLLVPNRTHTSLSVGDEITICKLTNDANIVRWSEKVYVCAPVGFELESLSHKTITTPHDRLMFSQS